MNPGVSIVADDTRSWGLETVGPGLLLSVPSTGPWARRPALHLEVVPKYRLRLRCGRQTLLWTRIDSYWDQAVFVRGSDSAPRFLPAMTAPEVRAVDSSPGAEEWWTAWTWRMARALIEAPLTVLHAGHWCLRPVRAIDAEKAERHPVSPMEWSFGQPLMSPHSLAAATQFKPAWAEDWWESLPGQRPGAVLGLREASAAEDGRVKSWRKRAKDGTLPPILLLFVDILAKWVVLDGHDRLHAALLEGTEPPLLGLWPFIDRPQPWNATREEGALLAAEIQLRTPPTPDTIDRINRMLLFSFAHDRRGTVSRAWPLPGGHAAWREELSARRRMSPSPLLDEEDWDWLV
ncbi:hypothetical protein MYSTI_02160 [Myxococcus stipitatus DSM 14675]|uniref:Uncharacterized protein n=1 Tax=Myxococcus stipitatus (strain DSM 14675 / JCM 12634 / Mx s8) TaxID=1278073 RepID=L7U7F3_MYXSD|nr:hypothetical protein [Myxococcus stipitatus]AGC43487.1 hypothetical protein MYSTI_02160 [Myxococcus stipitatus DSM 14675]